MLLLSRIEDIFTVAGRGCVIVPFAITAEVHNGDAVQLRSAEGNVVDARIKGIEMCKMLSGPCRVGLLLSENVAMTDVPLNAEIWVAASK